MFINGYQLEIDLDDECVLFLVLNYHDSPASNLNHDILANTNDIVCRLLKINYRLPFPNIVVRFEYQYIHLQSAEY